MYDAEIKFRRIYENPMTGLCTWELQDMEYLEFLSNIVRKEGWGKFTAEYSRANSNPTNKNQCLPTLSPIKISS